MSDGKNQNVAPFFEGGESKRSKVLHLQLQENYQIKKALKIQFFPQTHSSVAVSAAVVRKCGGMKGRFDKLPVSCCSSLVFCTQEVVGAEAPTPPLVFTAPGLTLISQVRQQ